MAECFFIYIEDTNSCGEAPNEALMKILKGDTGNGIASITQTSISEDELEKTYTITYTDGNEFEYIVKDGNSILSIEYIGISLDGLQETYQVNYQDGTTFQYVVNQGVGIKTITKASTTLLTDTYTITFADNSTTTFDVKNGNGIESIAKTNTNVLVDTYTITFTDTTTTTFDVTNAKSITNIEFVDTNLLTDTYKINFNDNTNITFEITNGRGINNVSYISTNGLVDTYRITYNDNTTSDFIVTNGQGYTEKGEWNELTHYMPYDVVHYLNSVYVCLIENEGSLPTNENTDWEMWLDSTEFLNKTAVSLYNITNEIPLPAGSYYTLATAIAAIPTNIRKLGLKITFQVSATNTETWEFFNGTIGNITNVAYWRKTANSTDLDLKINKTAIKQALGDSETDVMSQKAITEAIMKAHDYDINFFAYGVSRDLTGAGTTLTRVGNLSLHKTRPILRKSIGCVKNAQGVQYYLDNNTDFLKADGVTPSVLDGTDGDVMTEIPEMYVYEYTDGDYEYTYLSEFPLPNFKRIPKTYHGRYEGSYDTTTNQLRSVINSNIRGGLPATGKSVFYYNSGAIKDRNLDWSPDRLLSHYVRGLLFRVHYATYDSQAPYNSALTPEGYLQGGLSIGVTDINSTKWSKYNGYNPFIPCGYTAELGNKTGVKEFYMPFEYDGYNTTAGDNTQYYKGVYNASTAYNVNELVADMEDSVIGKGDGKLYKCILNAPAGTELTNTTYFALQTRTKTQANRFLVEIPFGHTFKQTIDAIIELTDNYTTTKCYVYDNPAHFASTKTANARFLCNMPSAEGYVKLFNKYTIVPYSIGGSSGSWGYDYFYWRGEAGGALRGLLFSGAARNGSDAGLGCSHSANSPAIATASIGVRLCCFLEGSNIV